MIVSPAGLMVLCSLLVLGYAFGSPIIIGLFASLAFGATAIAVLTSVGGSSPLIYAGFAVLLLLSTFARRDGIRELKRALPLEPTIWIVLLLLAYVIIAAIFFPRLFAGQTSVFVLARTPGGSRIAEVPLAPVSGNISQTGYFALNCLTYIAFVVLLRRKGMLTIVRRGFFVLAALNLLLGSIDLAGKVAGAGDMLGPIRTASYSMLVSIEQAGFWRIVGGFPEASSFATAVLISLTFVATYWRATNSRLAFFLSVGLLILLVLSTSSSAYVVGACLVFLLLGSIFASFARSRMTTRDLGLVIFLLLVPCLILGFHLYSEKLTEPFAHLLESTLWNKAQSGSAQERAYWNIRSIDSFFDTYGIGIGIGSSRASSWVIAVISQLGFVGALLQGALVIQLLRPIKTQGTGSIVGEQSGAEIVALARSAQASAAAGIGALALIGSSADPGLLFFISLAVVEACRHQLSDRAVTQRQTRGLALQSAVTSVG